MDKRSIPHSDTNSTVKPKEIGDFNEEIHVDNYVSSLNLALRQTEILEKKIMELHKRRQPYQDLTVAIDEFMGIARGLETYGIDPHPVRDHRGSQLYVGINFAGISTFVSGKRSQHFRWNEVHKINFEGKMFIAHLSYTDASREPPSTSRATQTDVWKNEIPSSTKFYRPIKFTFKKETKDFKPEAVQNMKYQIEVNFKMYLTMIDEKVASQLRHTIPEDDSFTVVHVSGLSPLHAKISFMGLIPILDYGLDFCPLGETVRKNKEYEEKKSKNKF